MRIMFAATFVLISILPMAASAQRDCHGSAATTIEIVPNIAVRHTGATEMVNEPLGNYLSSHDRGEVMEALTALSVRHHVNCGRTLRVQFAYDERIRRYAASIRVREDEDCCSRCRPRSSSGPSRGRAAMAMADVRSPPSSTPTPTVSS